MVATKIKTKENKQHTGSVGSQRGKQDQWVGMQRNMVRLTKEKHAEQNTRRSYRGRSIMRSNSHEVNHGLEEKEIRFIKNKPV